MKQVLLVFMVCVVRITPLPASSDPFPIGARSQGMGYASVTFRDHWSLFNNVGGLAGVKGTVVMSSFSSLYGTVGLPVLALGVVKSTSYGTVGLGIQRFGDDWYSEHLIGLAFSHQLGNVSLGLKANYVQVAAAGLGSRGTVALEFGGVVLLTPELTFGAYLYNLNQARLADYQDERLPTLMKAGLSYKPSSAILLSAEAEKDIDFPAVCRFGLEYEVVKKVFLRTGVSSGPFSGHFGFGLQHKDLHFDYALTSHPQMGFSHHLSLAYRFHSTKKTPSTALSGE